MVVYRFSALSDGKSIRFNPTADALNFDQTAISAADIRFSTAGGNTRIEVVSGVSAGKDVTLLNTSPLQLSMSNVTFANGTRLLVGDTTSGTANDDAANNLVGTSGRDYLVGLGGNDTLNGGAGADRMDGGAGDDTYIVTSGDLLTDSGGTDHVQSTISWTLAAAFENLTLTGTSSIKGVGNSLNNQIVGNTGNNNISGRGGNDSLHGGAGNDIFDMSTGGAASYGEDFIDGGAGVDRLDFGSNAQSAVAVNLAAGTASGGGASGAGSARLVSIENVTGGAFADRIIGDTAANFLRGQSGDDMLDGAAGNDRLEGASGADQYLFSVAPGEANADLIVGFSPGTDKIVIDGTAHAASGPSGNLSASDARFFTGAAATSGAARVLYNQSTGELRYDADGGGDAAAPQRIATLEGRPALAATDIIIINGSGTVGGGSGGVIIGTSGDDTLVGEDNVFADNILDGADGNDTLIGGGGRDTFRFAAGSGNIGHDYVDGGGPWVYIDGHEFYSVDTLDYSGARSGVTIDLAAGTGSGGGSGNSGSITFVNIDHVTGSAFDDRLIAHDGALYNLAWLGQPAGWGDPSDGYFAGATMDGYLGNDTLVGGASADLLVGGAGQDSFVFRFAPGTTNADTIHDFVSGIDNLQLDDAVHPNIGALGSFRDGDPRYREAGASSGQDLDYRVLYNRSNGELYYDSDGDGPIESHLIAALQGSPSLMASDIIVI